MKQLLTIALFSVIISTNATAYDLDAYGRPINNAANSAYNTNSTTWDGYGKSYTRQGNQVNSSDGSVYRPYGASRSSFGSGSNGSCTPNFSTGGCL